jgi:cellulose synthase (UDP-forming)
MAFVQSPQAFFNRSFQHPRHSEDPLLNEQSLFYDVICAGKDRNNATFWCGSSAVLRKEAVEAVGGIATETVVEDAHTGMRLHAAGWNSAYHPEVLAVGLAPEDVNAFIVQRGRWATGCYQLLRKDNPLFIRGLSFRQRIHYLASLFHYLEGPQRLIALTVPPLALLTGTVPLVAPQSLYLALFLPQFVLVPLASRAIARGRYRLLDGERYGISRAAAYTKAMGALFTSKPIAFKVTPKGAGTEADGRTILRVPLALAALAAAGIIYQTATHLLELPGRLPTFAFAVTATWAALSIVFSSAAVQWAAAVRHRRRAHRFPVQLDAYYTSAGGSIPRRPVTITDLNTFGLAMLAAENIQLSERIDVTVDLEGDRLLLSGTTVRIHHRDDGTSAVGVAFAPVAATVTDAIARWCFRHPFGPDVELDPEHRPELLRAA